MGKKGNNSSAFVLLSILLIINGGNNLISSVYATSKVHIVYMGEKPQHLEPKRISDSHYDMLASVLGSKEAAANSMVYSYRYGFSGFAAKLTEAQAQQLAEVPGVIHVTRNHLYSSQTTRSWDYLGLSAHSPSNLLHKGNKGDGIIIGVLDSGIWPESRVFDDKGYGPIPSHWKGHCESGQLFNATNCNKKVIGAKWFIDGFLAENQLPYLNTTKIPEYLSPRDYSGHGTHVTSIAAGSSVDNASYKGLGLGVARGGAPGARIAVYKVLWGIAVQGSQCDILKAFDEAIKDGVDLLSVSIAPLILGPPFSEVDERDPINIGSLHAVARGIPVICAAGNTGPSAHTVRNTAPWIITVAAATIDRSFPTPLTLGNNVTILGQAMFKAEETSFSGLVFPEINTCEDIPLSLNNTSVEGKVVLCFSKNKFPYVANIIQPDVKAAGGVGLIVAGSPSNILSPCQNGFPCVAVDYELGTQILFYIRSTRFPTVRISLSKTLTGKPVSTKVADFSARGPNPIAPSILKPDIAAPGVNILAAYTDSNPSVDDFFMQSGTSMAAPHVSGIVALLKVIHPKWSPAAIRSAIVTTAWQTDPFGEPIFAEGSPRKLADPFDFGGGLINPEKASEPGLIYDMDTNDYIHYLCARGYNDSSIYLAVDKRTTCPSNKPSVLDVNLPSITIPNLSKSVTLNRRLTNVGPENSIYKASIQSPLAINVAVIPDVLEFNSTMMTMSFKVTVSTSHKVNTGFYFGSLTWTDGVHSVVSPISVRTQIIQNYTDEN